MWSVECDVDNDSIHSTHSENFDPYL
jgi:hypothetical protein